MREATSASVFGRRGGSGAKAAIIVALGALASSSWAAGAERDATVVPVRASPLERTATVVPASAAPPVADGEVSPRSALRKLGRPGDGAPLATATRCAWSLPGGRPAGPP